MTPLIARPERSAFNPAGVVRDPPAVAYAMPVQQGSALVADARFFLLAWAAGMVVFSTLFA